MMYIVFDGGREVHWHVGETLTDCIVLPSLVEQVQADGDELDWIKDSFTNMPVTTKRVGNWYGDLAKMIVAGVPTI